MKVETSNGSLYVYFTHITTGEHRKTEASIVSLNGEEKNTLSTGITSVHHKDNYDRDKGRKLSLQRALAGTTLSKEDKVKFWEVYRNWGKNRW